jgi:FkbM family methyltransferase
MRFAPNGRHIAIEPSPTRSALLKKRFPSVTVIAVAISDRDGNAQFIENPDWPGFSRLKANISNKEAFCWDVTTSRIDSLHLPEKIDLIKLDIEDGELAALRGGENLLQRDRPIVIFECGTEYQEFDRNGLFQFFIDRNYDVFTFGDFLFEKGPLTYDEFRKCGLYPFRANNYLALPRCAGTGS